MKANDGRSPAEIYEAFFVPALFRQWGPVIAQAAAVVPNEHVLDVACGTGVLACAAAERVGAGGRVVGLDANPQMLAVARRRRAPVEWVEGRAEQLPFDDRSFDAVLSQFGFMFFVEPPLTGELPVRAPRPALKAVSGAEAEGVEAAAGPRRAVDLTAEDDTQTIPRLDSLEEKLAEIERQFG